MRVFRLVVTCFQEAIGATFVIAPMLQHIRKAEQLDDAEPASLGEPQIMVDCALAWYAK